LLLYIFMHATASRCHAYSYIANARLYKNSGGAMPQTFKMFLVMLFFSGTGAMCCAYQFHRVFLDRVDDRVDPGRYADPPGDIRPMVKAPLGSVMPIRFAQCPQSCRESHAP
jgi:hypothetical protein